jgi:hypothetical protein
LWKTSGKAEILKNKKIVAEDIRTFTFADPFYTLAFAHCISGLKEFYIGMGNCVNDWPFRPGVAFAHGGFSNMMSTLEGKVIVEGDARKWDSSFTSVVAEAVQEVFEHQTGIKPGHRLHEFFTWALQQRLLSAVVMPDGSVRIVPYMPSGSPDTTIANCLGHLFILVDHLLDSCEEEGLDPFLQWLKCNWHLFADDHLNGYPRALEAYLSYERRVVSYNRVGAELHPPPQDKIHQTPIGTSFLGAVCYKEHGEYVPQFDKNRLLAILYCNDYDDEKLVEVLTSIAPIVHTNPEAYDIYVDYVRVYYPRLLGLLTVRPLFTGAEATGGKGGTIFSMNKNGSQVETESTDGQAAIEEKESQETSAENCALYCAELFRSGGCHGESPGGDILPPWILRGTI